MRLGKSGSEVVDNVLLPLEFGTVENDPEVVQIKANCGARKSGETVPCGVALAA